MILDIILVIIGIPLALFLPGYLLTVLILKDLETFHKVLIGIGLSLAISIALGFILSFIGSLLNTKGLTPISVVISLIVLSLIFLELIIIREKRMNR